MQSNAHQRVGDDNDAILTYKIAIRRQNRLLHTSTRVRSSSFVSEDKQLVSGDY